MNSNMHSQPIASDKIQSLQDNLNSLVAGLIEVSVTLTPEDRRELTIMGDKTVNFVNQAHEQALKNPGLVPAYLDMTAFTIDKTDAAALHSLRQTAEQVLRLITDTEMVAGSEAYQAALAFYGAVKLQASQHVPGAQPVYDELKTRFPRGHRKEAASKPTA